MRRLLIAVTALAGLVTMAIGATADAQPARARRVWVVAVPLLSWSDVTPATYPAIVDLEQRAGTAVLSGHVHDETASVRDAFATLVSGARRTEADIGGRPAPLTAALDAAGIASNVFDNPGGNWPWPVRPEARVVSGILLQPDVARAIPDITRGMVAGDVLIVVGIGDASLGPPGLRVALKVTAPLPEPRVNVPERRGLSSATTHLAGYVQLIDVAPTVLAELGLPTPTGMSGRSWRSDWGVDLRRAEENAERDRVSRGPVLLFFVGVGLAVAFASTRSWGAPLAGYALALALVVGMWGWFGVPPVWVTLLVIPVLAVVVATVLRTSPLLALPVLAIGLFVDALFNGWHQLDAPFGYSPLGGGRFSGLGNAASALLVAATVVAVGHRRRVWSAAVAGGLVVVVLGWPTMGDDVGGALTAAVASGVLVLGRSGARWTRLRIAAVAAVGVATAGLVMGIDYTRPAAEQTHAGRFIGQLLHGGAGEVVRRRLTSAATSLWHTELVLLAIAGVVLLVTMRRSATWPALTADPATRATLTALVVAATVGTVANDSGVVAAGMTAAVGVPWLVTMRERFAADEVG